MKTMDSQAANNAITAQAVMAHRMALEEYLAKSAEDAVALIARDYVQNSAPSSLTEARILQAPTA